MQIELQSKWMENKDKLLQSMEWDFNEHLSRVPTTIVNSWSAAQRKNYFLNCTAVKERFRLAVTGNIDLLLNKL